MRQNLGFWDDWTLPDVDFSMPDFDLPDFDFPDFDFDFDFPDFDFDFDFPDFDFSLPDFGFGEENIIPEDAFAGQYFDNDAIPDFDVDSFLSSFDVGDFDLGDFNPGFEFDSIDSFLSQSGEVGALPSEGAPPILDQSGTIVDSAGKSSGTFLDSIMKTAGQLMPVVKNLAGQFFAYQRSSNALTGRTQYTPRQISQMQAAQIAAQQRAYQMNALNQQQAQAAQAYQQQLALQGTGGLSSSSGLLIVGGIALLAVVLMSRR